MATWNTCRFCKQSAHSGCLVKYEVRHYAHYECYLKAGKKLDALHVWQVGQFPLMLLRDHGLEDETRRIFASAEARGEQ